MTLKVGLDIQFFELQNGQIWKQDKCKYKYFYAYRPTATIVKIGSRHIMTVKGKTIRVITMHNKSSV